MSKFSRIYMPNIVCGRGSLSFAASLGKKRVAVLGYADTVAELAKDVFKDTDAEVRYIATVSHEPLYGTYSITFPPLWNLSRISS